jgi:hypothetical protein
MILNGKAKNDFLEWVQNKSQYISFSSQFIIYENSARGEFLWYGNEVNLLEDTRLFNALIIEWLDSVGVYIFINNDFQFGYSIYEDGNTYPTKTKIDFSTRQEATTEAIKKANELINQTL